MTELYPYHADWPPGFVKGCQEFFASESSREVGLDSYDDIFTSRVMFLLQRRRELEQIIRLVRPLEPRTIMDIGSDKGGGVYHWVKCFPSVTRMIACEIRGCPYASLFEQHFPDVRFYWIQGTSQSEAVRDQVAAFAEGPLDVLFIDGDKGGTLRDFSLYAPLVRSGGLVFIHDINEPGHPRDTYQDCARSRRHKEIIDTSESGPAQDREHRGEPADTAYEAWLRYWHGRSAGVGVLWV